MEKTCLCLQRTAAVHQKAQSPSAISGKNSMGGAPAETFLLASFFSDQTVDENAQNSIHDEHHYLSDVRQQKFAHMQSKKRMSISKRRIDCVKCAHILQIAVSSACFQKRMQFGVSRFNFHARQGY